MSLRPALLIPGLLLAACTTAVPVSPSPGEPSGTGSTPQATGSPEATATPTAEPTPEPARWSALDVANGPSAREDHSWTLAPDGRAYLFGGRDGGTVFGDLWAYDLADGSWEQLEPDGSAPRERFGHGAAWVEPIGLVIHAGQVGTTFFDDLWAYDPQSNAWRLLPAPQTRPLARYGSCATLGPDGRFWISHGFTSENARFADTWAYDFTAGAWTEQTPPAERPVNRCLHACWWTADQLVLYGGQTTGTNSLGDLWAFDAGERPGTSEWAQLDGSLPPARNLYASARLDEATLVFGGQGNDRGYLDDLWLIDDASLEASQVVPAGEGPAPRSGAEMVVDPDGGRVLLFGGRDADESFADLWELSLPGE